MKLTKYNIFNKQKNILIYLYYSKYSNKFKFSSKEVS